MPYQIDQLKIRDIDDSAMERFFTYCERRSLAKKHVVFRDGDVADTLYYIISGSVSVMSKDDEGKDVVLAYLNAGEFIGEIGLFYEVSTRNVLVRTRTECELAEIKYEDLTRLFETELKNEHAHILHAVGVQLSQRLLKTSRRVTRLAYMDVQGRIARTLLDLCEDPEAMSHPKGTQVHISRQELGRIVGCAREVVGRVLKKMQEEGMVEVHGMDIVVIHPR